MHGCFDPSSSMYQLFVGGWGTVQRLPVTALCAAHPLVHQAAATAVAAAVMWQGRLGVHGTFPWCGICTNCMPSRV
jgi:hypothetical protein